MPTKSTYKILQQQSTYWILLKKVDRQYIRNTWKPNRKRLIDEQKTAH
jgi:hypothetical protein